MGMMDELRKAQEKADEIERGVKDFKGLENYKTEENYNKAIIELKKYHMRFD